MLGLVHQKNTVHRILLKKTLAIGRNMQKKIESVASYNDKAVVII